MDNYDQWRTTSDIDYEDSCNTECYDTDEDLNFLLEIVKKEQERFFSFLDSIRWKKYLVEFIKTKIGDENVWL